MVKHKFSSRGMKLLAVLGVFGLGFMARSWINQSQRWIGLSPVIPVNDNSLPVYPSGSSQAALPGNSFATAFHLVPGYDTRGTLSSSNILDVYDFSLSEAAKVRFTGTNTPQDYRWYLYDSGFNILAATVRTGVVEGLSTVVVQKPGKYYLVIIGKYSAANNLPYTVRLDILPFQN